MNENPFKYSWHPRGIWRHGFLVASIGVVAYLVTRPDRNWLLLGVCSFFVVLALGVMTEQEVRIDTTVRRVCREVWLPGRIHVWSKEWQLDDFVGVALRRQRIPGAGEVLCVGLIERAGKFMAVSYAFVGTGRSCQRIEEISSSLATSSGFAVMEVKA